MINWQMANHSLPLHVLYVSVCLHKTVALDWLNTTLNRRPSLLLNWKIPFPLLLEAKEEVGAVVVAQTVKRKSVRFAICLANIYYALPRQFPPVPPAELFSVYSIVDRPAPCQSWILLLSCPCFNDDDCLSLPLSHSFVWWQIRTIALVQKSAFPSHINLTIRMIYYLTYPDNKLN